MPSSALRIGRKGRGCHYTGFNLNFFFVYLKVPVNEVKTNLFQDHVSEELYTNAISFQLTHTHMAIDTMKNKQMTTRLKIVSNTIAKIVTNTIARHKNIREKS